MIASTPPPPAAGKQWRMEALETVEAVGVLDGSNVWPVKHFGSSAHDCLHPPTCCRCVLRLSIEEKTHSSRPNIYREEKGEHFWSKKLIPQILLQHIWSIWLVSGHYKKIWDSSFWNQPKSKVNILLWKRHGCARGIRPPRSPEWICMKYFRFGVKMWRQVSDRASQL